MPAMAMTHPATLRRIYGFQRECEVPVLQDFHGRIHAQGVQTYNPEYWGNKDIAPNWFNYVGMIIQSYWLRFCALFTRDSKTFQELGIPETYREHGEIENPALHQDSYFAIRNLALEAGHHMRNRTLTSYIEFLKSEIPQDEGSPVFINEQLSTEISRDRPNQTNVPLEQMKAHIDLVHDRNPNASKVFIPLVLTKKVRKEGSEHGTHIVMIVYDKIKGELYYLDPQGFPIDHPENLIGRDEQSYHVREIMRYMMQKYEIPKEKMFQNHIRLQHDIHSCGVHIGTAIRDFLAGKSFAEIILDPKHAHDRPEERRMEMARELVEFMHTLEGQMARPAERQAIGQEDRRELEEGGFEIFD